MVDAASVEGRDPVEDIKAINEELSKYNPELLKRPQVIAANKIDALPPDDTTFIDMIKEEFEPQGIKVFPISAVSGKGLKELLWEVQNLLDNIDDAPIIFEQEFDPDAYYDNPEEPFYVFKDEEEDDVYRIEGPRIDRMLGYTNLESEKGFVFFQKFMKDNGILDQLEELGIQEGDTVKIYGHEFEYLK
jgi:GTP-binding protein